MSYHFGVEELIEQRLDEFAEFAQKNEQKMQELVPDYGQQPIER